MVVEIHFWKER